MSDFLDNFNPFRHDLLYGTQAPRETYVLAYIEHRYNQLSVTDKAKYDDLEDDDRFPEDYAGEVYTQIENEGIYVNSYNEPITSGDFRDLGRVRLANPKNQRIARYHRSLQRTKYAVDRIGAATLQSLAKGDSNLRRATGKDQISRQDLTATSLHLAVRRACKFGIEYITGRRNGVVHYVLDGITMTEVVNKTTYGVMGGGQGVPITTSELRFLFRNWHDFEERAFAQKIFFYVDQSTVGPPWYAQPAIWTPYAAHRLQKSVAVARPAPSLIAAQEQFQALVGEGRHRAALDEFFSVPTSELLIR